jgi:hypothetical protein
MLNFDKRLFCRCSLSLLLGIIISKKEVGTSMGQGAVGIYKHFKCWTADNPFFELIITIKKRWLSGACIPLCINFNNWKKKVIKESLHKTRWSFTGISSAGWLILYTIKTRRLMWSSLFVQTLIAQLNTKKTIEKVINQKNWKKDWSKNYYYYIKKKKMNSCCSALILCCCAWTASWGLVFCQLKLDFGTSRC